MKRLISIIMVLCMLSIPAFAEMDLTEMSLEELEDLRSEVSSMIVELLSSQEQDVSEDAIGTIEELFPDEALAKAVRNELGFISISQSVTQDDLDRIREISFSSESEFGSLKSLVGIGLLSNLEEFYSVNYAAENLKEIPEEFYTLTNLEQVVIHGSSISSISPSIGNLVNLERLELSGNNITSLPDELINCTNLEKLDLSYSKLTEIPPVLLAIKGVEFDLSGTGIK